MFPIICTSLNRHNRLGNKWLCRLSYNSRFLQMSFDFGILNLSFETLSSISVELYCKCSSHFSGLKTYI